MIQSGYYRTTHAVWEVIMDDFEIKHDSPKLYIVATDVSLAAQEAELVMKQDLPTSTYRALSVKILNEVNSVRE